MLSVQSLQTLRGAAAVNDCSRGRVAGALSLGCFPRYAFSRAQVVPLAASARAEQPQLFGLANTQRSRAAWIAHSLQRSRTTLISAVDLR